jgi:cell division protein FtsQ
MLHKRNRKRTAQPALKLPPINWRAVAVTVAVAAVTAGAWPLSRWLLNRPIETIVISGSFQRVSPMQIEAQVEARARSGFLDVNLAAIRGDLVELPWVAGAEVRRKWPGTLEVRVREEVPVACWGERGLLNAAGKLFLANAEHVPAELPRLHGPAGTEAQVTARYFAVQEQLEHRGLAATTLTLDPRGAWSFTTSSGLQVRLGANAVDERIGRFFEVFDGTLGQIAGDVDYVDMRYPNGFAVGWKDREAARAVAVKEPQPHA